MHKADIVIVGAGITGITAALFLRRADVARHIVVIDELGMGQGQTLVQPGGVRQQWTTEVACRMAQYGHRFYRNAAKELSDPAIRFRAGGYLFLLHSPEEWAEFDGTSRLHAGLGIRTELVPQEELRRRFPFFGPGLEATGAAFSPEDGYFDDPKLVVRAIAREAQRLGVQFRREAALSVVERSGRVEGVRTADGAILAERVVLAAAMGTRHLAGTVGVDLPIGEEPRFLLYSAPLPPVGPEPLIISSQARVALKQLESGRVLASYLGAKEGEDVDLWRARIGDFARTALPALSELRLDEVVMGRYDSTPDHQGIVSAAGPEGLYVAAGMSGHGFMMAPAVAQTLLSLITRGEGPGWSLAALALDRFQAGGAAEGERRVI